MLNIDGVNYTKPQDLATKLSGFFVNKIVRIKQNLGPPTQDPLLTLKAVMGKWVSCGQIRSFSFQPISVKVVKKIIKKMKKSGAECSLSGFVKHYCEDVTCCNHPPNETLDKQDYCHSNMSKQL